MLKATVATALLALTASGAAATSVLLYDDFSFRPPPQADPASAASHWPTALAGLGLSFTQVGSDAAFNMLIDDVPAWDLVVVQLDFFYHAIEPGLLNYIAGGGKVIFSNWESINGDPDFDPASANDGDFGVVEAGFDLLTLELTPLFAAGLSGTSLMLDPGDYFIWSRSFLPGPGTVVAGTFEDGNAGIVVGNSGRTIINGFMGDTLTDSDEIRLYQNEIRALIPAQVPGPASGTLLGLGLALVGAVLYWRKRA